MPVADIFRAYMGTDDGPSRGRDGHYGALALGVLPPITFVGDVVPIVTGMAMSFVARGRDSVAAHLDRGRQHQDRRGARGDQFRRGAPSARHLPSSRTIRWRSALDDAAPPRRG